MTLSRANSAAYKKIYKRIVDEWILYDNSAPAPLILEHGGKLEHEEQTS